MRINRLTLRSSSFLPLLLLGAISVPGNRQCTKDNELQLYKTNYSGAQKFTFKKQYDDHGKPTYRISPLYVYDMILNFNGNDENISASLNKEALQ